MFSKRKNKCNRGGLLLRTADSIERSYNKNKLIAELNLCGLNEAASFIHNIIIETKEDDSFTGPDGDDLIDAFIWSETPQGGSYWNNIDNKLEDTSLEEIHE